MPTKPAGPGPEDGSGSMPPDELPADPSRGNPIAPTRILAGGYVARHPALLRVFEWLGWNNPGGGMNP